MATDTEQLLELRWFDREADLPMLQDWCLARGHACMPLNLLPRLGVVAQLDGRDSAAAFCYLDSSCGAAFLDHVATRPGLKVWQAKACLHHLHGFLAGVAKDFDYAALFAYVPEPLARHMPPTMHRQKRDLAAFWQAL
jgi:hypothetical protein